MPDFFDSIRPLVDSTITALAEKGFAADPICEPRYSRITSVVSSAYKRHGKIIEAALIARLKECDDLDVWREPRFRVSQAASTLANNEADCLGASLAYPAEGSEFRTIQIDLLAYDRRTKRIGSYECKRTFGKHDAGKVRSIRHDTLSAQVLLKSYGEQNGYDVDLAEARIIFYYGVRSLPPPWSLVADELDEHFNFDVRYAVERVNAYFRERLDAVLSAPE